MRKQICEHVIVDLDKEAKPPVLTVIRGLGHPFFGWSPKLQADVPLLRCVICHKSIPIRRLIVKQGSPELDTTIGGRSNYGKAATRKQTRKQNKTKSRDEIS